MTDSESSKETTALEKDDSIEGSLAGIQLKTKREELKMTIEEVASNLNLDVSYIAAIETNDYSTISSTSYVYGYIRSYAKLLRLPEQEILDLYMHDNAETSQLLPDYLEEKKVFTNNTRNKSSMGLLIVIVFCLLFLTWWFISK